MARKSVKNDIDIRKIKTNSTVEKRNSNMTKKKKKKNKIIPTIIITSIITILSLLLVISTINNIKLSKKKNKVKIEYKNDENIVFFGDSITSIYEIEHFFPNNKTINSGISGDETTDLLERINDDLYIYNPSKVFLLIGINDLDHGVDKKEILKNIQKIINGIKVNRKYAEIYVESVYPINQELLIEDDYGFNEDLSNDDIKEFNEKIKELCEKSNVTYIDIYSELVDEDGNLNEEYTKEGLHLNDLGYLKVTEILNKYIKK